MIGPIRRQRILDVSEPVSAEIVRADFRTGFRHRVRGDLHAPILVVCDPPRKEAADAGLPMSMEGLKLIGQSAGANGFTREDFCFVGLCPPLPEEALDSQSRKWKHVANHVDSLWEVINDAKPRCIVTTGDLATRAVVGRALAITKARGQPVQAHGYPVFPMLSPAFVNKVPDHLPTFRSDFAALRRFANGEYQAEVMQEEMHYEWREDISDILARRDQIQILGVDTETTGTNWHDPRVRVLTVQIATAPGEGFVCPIDLEFWPEWNGRLRQRARLISQLKQLLEDPSIPKAGHNLKFDVHMLRKEPLRIEIQNWRDDTQLLAFAVDENMMEKSQEECLRRWVPALVAAKSSVSDAEKGDMLHLPREKFLAYAGSDPDGVLRLCNRLLPMMHEDVKQTRCYHRIMMPSLRTFANVIERYGMLVDRERLTQFGIELDEYVDTKYRELIAATPSRVRRKHLDAGKALSFARTDFVRDILFTPAGFNLKPLVFTKTTQRLPDDQKMPSTSSKDHLPFFVDREDAAGEYCQGLIEYQKAQKLSGTYVGKESEGNGLWQYIAPNHRIYPSYALHKTNTGRTASSNPNGQNFPKRGRWAKPYQKIFKATPGFKLINCDLSQIELRIAAWMAMEPRMLQIYRDGGDIHTATAMAVSGLTRAQWDALPHIERKLMRTKAKSVNFGFLYGMGAKKFRNFAKTDYGVTYTEREAIQTREVFFRTYAALPAWHNRMREDVHALGYVRALHGAIRHLPSIHSNDQTTVSGAERQAINAPVQRFGSDLGLMAMCRFSAQADPDLFRIIGFVHDALVMEAREGYEREGLSALLWTMNNSPLERWFDIRPPLPLIAEGDIGINGGEMLELADLPPLDKRPQWFIDLGWETAPPVKPEWWDDNKELEEDRAVEHLLANIL